MASITPGVRRRVETAGTPPVEQLELTNSTGSRVMLLTLGATVTGIHVPDRDGRLADVVLGYERSTDYLASGDYLGAVVGRFANRIAGAAFTLNGRTIRLAANEGTTTLHGGPEGLHRQHWDVSAIDNDRCAVELRHVSPAGSNGFPGTVDFRVRYRLDASNALRIRYRASTDADTVVNLTHHGYFNLDGHDCPDVGAHRLQIRAQAITAVNERYLPTGELLPVDNTPFDFRQPKRLDTHWDANHPALPPGGGYDNNWVIDGSGGECRAAATLVAARSGRRLEVSTDQPGLQVYTANALSEVHPGKNGTAYRPKNSVCLETQGFPDSPNQPSFPPTVLAAGETFESETVYAFSAA